jgi:hypothetical protein
MSLPPRPPIDVVVAQHLDDAIVLRGSRRVLVRGPHVKLLHLDHLDERLAAHINGRSAQAYCHANSRRGCIRLRQCRGWSIVDRRVR